jgi:hypothetical protein
MSLTLLSDDNTYLRDELLKLRKCQIQTIKENLNVKQNRITRPAPISRIV